jgi:hypothetical protein
MPPTRRKGKMKEEARASTSAGTQTSEPIEAAPPKETIVTAPPVDSPTTSPTFQTPGKTPPRRVLRLKCTLCNDYPDGFVSTFAIQLPCLTKHRRLPANLKRTLANSSASGRSEHGPCCSLKNCADLSPQRSEHELRRHSNRIHRKTRKVWVTIDTSPDKSFLANCKACQTGKRYNECYNAASHLRRMHFHPHKRGERKMSAAEARRGGKPGDLDPPMDVLKANWLREVDEIVAEGDEQSASGGSPDEGDQVERSEHEKPGASGIQLQPQPAVNHPEGKAPPTPTTPSTRSMAIDSIVDKMDTA